MKESYKVKRDFLVCETIGLNALTREECVEKVFDLPTEPVSATVALAGIPAVVSAHEHASAREAYEAASMTVIDGMPMVNKARRLGFVCERCSGPNIMAPIFEESVKRSMTHYFYGGKNDEVLKKLADNLQVRFPGIRIAGMYSPPFRPLTAEEDAELCAEVNTLHPDFLWVGIGAPKQEIWMHEHCEKIHGTRMLGVGAAFDFYAGTLEKAPTWIEDASLEWLFRLTKEPKRLWKRYILGGFKYMWLSTRHKTRLIP